MKKFIISIFTSLTLLSAGSISNVGLAFSKGDDSSKNITTFVSYNILAGVDLRFEYNRNISDYKEFANADINRYALFATYTQPIGSSFSITPKIGLSKTDGKFETIDTLKKVTDSSTDFTYGVEINYDINNMASAFVGYTDYGHKFKKLKDVKASKINGKNITVGFKINL